MTFSSVFVRCCAAALLAFLGACSSVNEEELFGYEEDFIIPLPDMVPVTPDDKPGRTVDEMLHLKQSVTVKKAVYPKRADRDETYERAGRFGSKEKVSLRKGLNAPDAGIVYGPRKRRAAEVVRPLELKEREKDDLLAVSEEEMLAEIIAPKKEGVEMIEVVSVAGRSKEETVKRQEVRAVDVKPVVIEAPVLPEQPKQPEPTVVKAPEPVLPAVTLKAPEPQETTLEPFELKPLVQPEPVIELTPPDAGNKIVLIPPSGEESIEFFLEE